MYQRHITLAQMEMEREKATNTEIVNWNEFVTQNYNTYYEYWMLKSK